MSALPEPLPLYRQHDRLNYEQAELEFGISYRHLRTLREEGRVPTYKVGGRVTFKWIDLHDYVESLRTKAVR